MKFSIHVNNRLSENDDNNTISLINSFIFKANEFIQKTEEHTLQGLNPGGIYQAIMV